MVAQCIYFLTNSRPELQRKYRLQYMALTALICDDSLLARNQLKKSLPADLDANIVTASNGLEALAVLRAQEIGLMFLDLTMPELDGIGVLEAIKKEALDCLVIVVSADIQPEMQKRVMELGALAFIQKPASAVKLADVMHKYGLI
jgi:two-component system, chemotaxis family, chemotaxis protein CheY